MPKLTQRRAIALVSGGLDSMLAVRVIQNQGIHVEGVNFFTGFCVEGHTHAIRKKDQTKPKRNNALWAAEQLGIQLHIIDIVDEYKAVVLNPKHGYGTNLNPCIDCKIFMVGKANLMLNKARALAEEKGFDFIITGEVLGQRPKSQRSETLPLIASSSGAEDRLVRPLSAKILPISLPEQEGWINRELLFGFHGRNRKPQIALARELGITDYAQPSGGCCFLTDRYYSKKLSDLWEFRGKRAYELDDIMLLKVGRHLRPAPHYKLILSREEGESNFLQGYRRQFSHIDMVSHPGPLTLIDGKLTKEDLQLAASIAARYSKGKDETEVVVKIAPLGQPSYITSVEPMPDNFFQKEWCIG